MECDDLKDFSMADEMHQREWREWFEKNFDKEGKQIENKPQSRSENKKKKEETFGF